MLVVTAGTSDVPVAEEAAVTAEFMKNRVEGKAAALKRALGPDGSGMVPAGLVRPHDGGCLWLVDAAAAGRPVED